VKKLVGMWWVLWLSLCSLPGMAADTDKPPITVFAAASLTNVLQGLGDSFTNDTSIPVRFSFAASSALARQIENGAPADGVRWQSPQHLFIFCFCRGGFSLTYSTPNPGLSLLTGSASAVR